jgi:hypothetical protein
LRYITSFVVVLFESVCYSYSFFLNSLNNGLLVYEQCNQSNACQCINNNICNSPNPYSMDCTIVCDSLSKISFHAMSTSAE